MAQAFPVELARIGSMSVFWPLIEPALVGLNARSVCEVGVAEGAFAGRLIAWSRERGCAYHGIDPALDLPLVEKLVDQKSAAPCRFHRDRSLAVLPTLDRCDAYFLDGDHNFYTVRRELELIARATPAGDGGQTGGPVVFVHDVGWPWGRRDMYYLPSEVPADARHPWSETQGVSLAGDELVDGGIREPGRYAIASAAGGPRNGVLCAVEDFLAGPDGGDWTSLVLPVAYGLAILYRPAHPSLPAECRAHLSALQTMAAAGEGFFRVCEQNYLQLFLYGEYTRHLADAAAEALQREKAIHYDTLKAYERLRAAYDELLAHSHALQGEYARLLDVYENLRALRAPAAR